jgi:hypothetical protein
MATVYLARDRKHERPVPIIHRPGCRGQGGVPEAGDVAGSAVPSQAAVVTSRIRIR